MTKGALSRHGERNRMKDDTTGKKSPSERGTNWTKLQAISDADIRAGINSDPQASATDDEFWKTAEVVLPARKEAVTIRLDADLLAWFRKRRGYQTHINAILRAYMRGHQAEP